MINVFQVASNDQSLVYLGMIFSNIGNALPGIGTSLLPNMFKVFNTALLVLGSLIVTYTTIIGVLATSHEGEFMGKNYHSIWVPIRTVGGIAALMPTSGGYCTAQVIMIWFIVQGVGMADMLWNTVTNSMANDVNAAPPTSIDMTGKVPDMIKKIFGSLVCQAAVTKIHNNNPGAYATSQIAYTVDSSGNNLPSGFNFGRAKDATDKESASTINECGSVQLSSSDPKEVAAQFQALQMMLPGLETQADYYAKQIVYDTNCWVPCNPAIPGSCQIFGTYSSFNNSNLQCIANDSQSNTPTNSQRAWDVLYPAYGSNFMRDDTLSFTSTANNYATAATSGDSTEGDAGDVLNKAQVNGWIVAGGYYYYLASKGNSNSNSFDNFIDTINVADISVPPTSGKSYFNQPDLYPDLSSANDPSAVTGNAIPSEVMNFYCGTSSPDAATQGCQSSNGGAIGVASVATDAMNASISTGGGVVSQSTGPSCDPFPKGLLCMIMSPITSGIMSGFEQMMAPGGSTNPITSIQHFGMALLNVFTALLVIFMGAAASLGLLSTNITALGTTLNYTAGMFNFLALYLIPCFFAILGYLISIGTVLGIYVPLIPYMLFTFGAIGWFTAVIEAIVAAPLVAIGILMPTGQHPIMGKAEHTLLIVLNILLRPSLMVFGLMAAMVLSYVVIGMINASFAGVMSSIMQGGIGIAGLVLFLIIIAYAFFIVTALNKCFSLIHYLPDKVLRYIGGSPESHGEESSLGEMKQGVKAGGSAVSGASSGMGSAASRGADRAGQKMKKMNDESANSPSLQQEGGEEGKNDGGDSGSDAGGVGSGGGGAAGGGVASGGGSGGSPAGGGGKPSGGGGGGVSGSSGGGGGVSGSVGGGGGISGSAEAGGGGGEVDPNKMKGDYE